MAELYMEARRSQDSAWFEAIEIGGAGGGDLPIYRLASVTSRVRRPTLTQPLFCWCCWVLKVHFRMGYLQELLGPLCLTRKGFWGHCFVSYSTSLGTGPLVQGCGDSHNHEATAQTHTLQCQCNRGRGLLADKFGGKCLSVS